MRLEYEKIERQLVEMVPEIAPAAENYWRKEGFPGEDCGAYIFFESMFAEFVLVLLHLPSSPSRDRLLSRAYGAVELMFSATDQHVQDLAYIGLLEGREPWWLQRSEPFLGPAARAELDRYRPEWRKEIAGPTMSPVPEVLDLYDVRGTIAKELKCAVSEIPGRTSFVGSEPAT